MADYWLTFRIHDNTTYSKRYDAFVKVITEFCSPIWASPTSFLALSTELDIDLLGSLLAEPLNRTTDVFLLREINRDSARYFGSMGQGFERFFPRAKKL